MNEIRLDTPKSAETQEERIYQSQFLAPVLGDGYLRIRLSGILCQLVPEDLDFEGWAILQPVSLSTARIVRRPDRALIDHYLRLFPSTELRLVASEDGIWYGVELETIPSLLKITGPVPVHLTDQARVGDHVRVRFDGQQFWFDRLLDRDGERDLRQPRSLPTAPGVVRFQTKSRRYRVELSLFSAAPPMVAGIALAENHGSAPSKLDVESLAGIVRRDRRTGGDRLMTTHEYAAAWDLLV